MSGRTRPEAEEGGHHRRIPAGNGEGSPCLSKAAAGALSAAYTAGALAGTVPSGLLTVRVGVKSAVLGGLS